MLSGGAAIGYMRRDNVSDGVICGGGDLRSIGLAAVSKKNLPRFPSEVLPDATDFTRRVEVLTLRTSSNDAEVYLCKLPVILFLKCERKKFLRLRPSPL